MSYEYEITLPPGKKLDLERLGEALGKAGRYRLLSITDSVVRGAFSSSPRDPHWPEDFEVSFNDATKLVSIPGGTASQRQLLLDDLRESIAAQGLACELEEL
jgi:hypothetical protein